MKKFLRFVLLAALLVPLGARAQVTCEGGSPVVVSNTDTSTTTVSYVPVNPYYGYSYTEVIIPADELVGLGQVKALMFKPTSTSGNSYNNNCEIYLCLTEQDNLSTGFVQDPTEFTLVYSGDLNWTNANEWRTVIFNEDNFVYDGTSNLLIAVRRNHGAWDSQSSFAAYSDTEQRARYIYQDGSAYTIGSITGGTATSDVPWYKLVGCAGAPISCNRVQQVFANAITSDGATINWIDSLNSGATYTVRYVAHGATDTVTETGVSGTSFELSMLDPMTIYDFCVYATCAGDEATRPRWGSFRTDCVNGGCEMHVNIVDNYYGYQLSYGASVSVYTASGQLLGNVPEETPSSYPYPTEVSGDIFACGGDTIHVVYNEPSYDWYTGYLSITVQNGDDSYVAFEVNDEDLTSGQPFATFELSCPACPNKPSNLVFDSVNTDNVTLHWTAYGDENSYKLYVNGEYYDEVSATSATVEGLTPGAVYTIGVAAVCPDDADYVSGISTISTRTACGVITGTYAENFSSFESYTEPVCWTSLTPNNYMYVQSGYLYGYVSNNVDYNTAIALTPQIGIATDSIYVTFKAQIGSGTAQAGLLYFPDDTSDYVFIPMVNIVGPTDDWTQFEFYTDTISLETDSLFVAFYMYGTEYNTLNVDDLIIRKATDCRPVAEVALSRLGYNSATVTWTPSVADADLNYEVRYGTGGNINMATDTVYTDENILTLNDLNPDQTYYVWVRVLCEDETVTDWKRLSFTTTVACDHVANIFVASQGETHLAFNWETSGIGMPATGYVFYFRDADSSTWQIVDTVENNFYYVDNLTPGHGYMVNVTTLCDTLASVEYGGFVSTNAICQIGTPDAYYNYVPFYTYYNNGVSEQIIYEEEMSEVGDTISSISLFSYGNSSVNRAVSIWMKNTDLTSFANNTSWVPVSSMTQVLANDTMMVTPGWNTFTFATPFVRTAGSNLLIAFNSEADNYANNSGWYGYTTDSTRSIYFYQDAAAYNPESPSGGSSGSGNFVNVIVMNTEGCEVNPCIAPVVFIENATEDEIDITWYPVVDGAIYSVEYRNTDSLGWTMATTTLTENSFSLTGLPTGSEIEFRISRTCGGDTLVGSVTGNTSCSPKNVPFYANFNDQNLGLYNRACWVSGSYSTGYSSEYPQVATFISSNNRQLMLEYGAYVVLPEFNVPIDQLQIHFKLSSSSVSSFMRIGLLEEQISPLSTMQTVATLRRSDYTEDGSWYVTYSFAGINTTNQFICLWVPYAGGQNFIDDLVVSPITECTEPDSLYQISATTNSITLGWNNIGATGYRIEYGPRNFELGTGTSVTSTTNSVTIPGLNPSTRYDAYVFPICNSEEGFNSNVAHLQTECMSTYTLPVSYNFADVNAPGVQMSNMLPTCWAYDPVYTSSSAYQIPSVYYYTYYDPTDGYILYMEDTSIVALPDFGIDADTLMIEFDQRNLYNSGYDLIVGVVDSITPGFGASFVPIDTLTYNGNENEHRVVYLSTYTGTGRHIALKNRNSHGYSYSYVYIDNLVVNYMPSCVPVRGLAYSNITTNTVDLQWVDNLPAEEWQVEMTQFGTNVTLDTIVNAHPFTFGGLENSSEYSWRVRPICSIGDTADWANGPAFRTECFPIVLTVDNPIYADFEEPQAPAVCWTLVYGDGNPGTNTMIHTTDDYGDGYVYEGQRAFRFSSMSSKSDYTQYLISPRFSSNDEIYIQFMARKHNDNETETIWIGYSTTSSDTNNFIWGAPLSLSNPNWQQYLDTIPAEAQFMAIRYWGNYAYYVYIDSLTITTNATACSAPEITGVVSGETELTINFTSEADSVEIVVNEGAFNPDATGVVVTGNTYTATGLTYSELYSIAIRSICGDGMVSEWTVRADSTLMVNCGVPTNLAATATDYNSISLSWTAAGEELAWEVSLYNTMDTVNVTSTTTSATVSGLVAGTAYNAVVRALCGNNSNIEGDWSDPITVSTDACEAVEGITVTPGSTTATVNWTATGNSYRVVWGELPFNPQDLSGEATVNTNSYVITGLDPETAYAVVIYNNCAEGLSMASNPVNFTTTAGGGDPTLYTVTVSANNDAWGSVTGSGQYVEGSTATISATANDGYRFVEWNDHNTDNPRTFTVTSNMSFTAIFESTGNGIEDVLAGTVSLYPNPASTSVTLGLEGFEGESQVEVVDMNGRVVIRHEVRDSKLEMNVSELPQGAYFVRVINGTRTAISKLIVK